MKNSRDKFYTSPLAARLCLEFLDLSLYDLIIEPAAGSGSFSKLLPPEKTLAFDLEPEGEGIVEQDWFLIDSWIKPADTKNVLIVGNPPFGVQNSLAVKFFNHSARIGDTIAFVLPLTFRKESLQNKLDKNFHLYLEYVLPRNSFMLNGSSYNVATVFQVWIKQTKPRKVKKQHRESPHFVFVKKVGGNPDLTIRRIGGHAGKASKDLNYSEGSNFFIKLVDHDVDSFIKDINNLDFASKSNAIGPRSINKVELVEEINNFYNKAKE